MIVWLNLAALILASSLFLYHICAASSLPAMHGALGRVPTR